MRAFNFLVVTLVVYGWTAPAAHGALISEFTFGSATGSSAAATSSDPNVVTSPFRDGDGALDFSSASITSSPFAFKSYEDLPDDAYSASSWFGFSVAPNAGYQLDLTALAFDLWIYSVQKFDDVISIEVRTSLDNFLTHSVAGDVLVAGHASPFIIFDPLTQGLTIQGLAQALEIRLYVYDHDTNSSGRGIHLDNVRLQGTVAATVAAVPEPASMLMFGTGALALVGCRWRKRRRDASNQA